MTAKAATPIDESRNKWRKSYTATRPQAKLRHWTETSWKAIRLVIESSAWELQIWQLSNCFPRQTNTFFNQERIFPHFCKKLFGERVSTNESWVFSLCCIIEFRRRRQIWSIGRELKCERDYRLYKQAIEYTTWNLNLHLKFTWQRVDSKFRKLIELLLLFLGS